MPSVGPLEIMVVLVIALLVFGPKRLPEMGRSVGNGLREFKDSLTTDKGEADDHAHIAAVVATPAPAPAPREAVRDRS